MNDDQLKQLLRAADDLTGTATGSPASVSGAAHFVDNLEAEITRRRTRRRRVAGAGTSIALVAIVVTVALHETSDPDGPNANARTDRVAESIDVESLRAEIAALNAEAEQRLQYVAALRHSVTFGQKEAELDRLEREVGPSPDLQAELAFRREVDRTAIISLEFADRLAEDLGEAEAAAAEYRRVAEQFPDTLWAAAAKVRLARVDDM